MGFICKHTIHEDFYLYPLGDHPHIILRVWWLFDLGDIHTNYQKLIMSFERDGRTHTLEGILDDCPQADSKKIEMIEWCQKEEATTLWLEGLLRLTLDQEENENPTLGIGGIIWPLGGS